MDARTDVFSFGVVLYELLAGRRPFAAGSRTDELNRIIHNSPEPLGQDVPLPLRMIVGKALHKDPAERYQTMRDVVVDLRALLRDRPASGMSVVDRPIRRSRVFALAAAALFLILVALGFQFWRSQPGTSASGARIRSLAVLPLQNLSGDPNQEFFSDGTTEALISSLAQIHSLDVISRTSSMRYKERRRRFARSAASSASTLFWRARYSVLERASG